MRVIRTILGLLLLTVGIPALLIGAAFWAVMQHRDAGGSFTGRLQPVVAPGYAVVVDDADQLISADAPFARRGDTRLRLTALTSEGPAFIGLAPAADVRRYLAEVPRQAVRSVNIGTGPLQIDGVRVAGSRAPAVAPGQAGIWLKAGNGQLDWNPATLRGSAYSLVIMSPSARPGIDLTATAAVSPGWLNSSTWALLILGSLVVVAGMIVLAWPMRRREVVYVVEPSQVPDLARAIGAPLPIGRTGGRHTGAHRPRTLADANSRSRTPAVPPTVWPPARRGTPASLPVSSSPASSVPVSPAPDSSAPVSPAPASAAAVTSSPASALHVSLSPASSVPVSPSLASAVPVSPAADPAPLAGTSPAAPIAGGSGRRRRGPAPGEPLKLLGEAASSMSGASALLGSPAAALTPPNTGSTRPAERIGRRRAPAQPEETPVFEATAVGAWVAETSAARARETEARAAAILAAEASKRAAADRRKGGAHAAPEQKSAASGGGSVDAAVASEEKSAASGGGAGGSLNATVAAAGDVATGAERVSASEVTAAPKTERSAEPAGAAAAPVGSEKPAAQSQPAAAVAEKAATAATSAQPAGPDSSADRHSTPKPEPTTRPVTIPKPVAPIKPAAPAKPSDPVKPAAVVKPANPAKPVTPAAPAGPVIPAKQSGRAQPVNLPAPAVSAQQDGSANPATPAISAPSAGDGAAATSAPSAGDPAPAASAPSAGGRAAASSASSAGERAAASSASSAGGPAPATSTAKSPAPAARAPQRARDVDPSRLARSTAETTPPAGATPDGTTSAATSSAATMRAPTSIAGTISASESAGETAPASRPAAGTTPAPKIEAPVHVPLSDRPAAVGQHGHAVPPRRTPIDGGGNAAPALSGDIEVASGSIAEVPRSTSDIQARLRAAMRSAGRPAGPRQRPGTSKPAQAGPQVGAQPQPAAQVGTQPGASVAERTGAQVDAQPSERASRGEAVAGPSTRSSNYAAEAAELLAGLSPNRRRRKPAIERLGPKPRTKNDIEPTDG